MCSSAAHACSLFSPAELAQLQLVSLGVDDLSRQVARAGRKPAPALPSLSLPAPRILAGLLGGALRRPHLLFEIGHDRSMRHGELGDLADI